MTRHLWLVEPPKPTSLGLLFRQCLRRFYPNDSSWHPAEFLDACSYSFDTIVVAAPGNAHRIEQLCRLIRKDPERFATLRAAIVVLAPIAPEISDPEMQRAGFAVRRDTRTPFAESVADACA
jgi:hypothetical protein